MNSFNKKIKALSSCLLAVLVVYAIIFTDEGVAQSKDEHAQVSSEDPGLLKSEGTWIPEVWQRYVDNDAFTPKLPDFSQAGYAMGERPLPEINGPVFDVTDKAYGAIPDDQVDDTKAIQAAIDAAGKAGGGVVLLPRGRYEIRSKIETKALQITSDKVVIRGEGGSAGGTVLHLGFPAFTGNVRRLGSVPAEQAARSGATIAVIGPENEQQITTVTADILRGQTLVRVADSSLLTVGQDVVIALEDPLIDEKNPDPLKADISVQLTSPFQLTADQTDTFGKASRDYTWIVKIDEILDSNTVRLCKPARFDLYVRYNPKITSFTGIREVGIENLLIESSWPGDYQHHKPYKDQTGKIIRTAKEQDYLWNGVWISHVVDSWVKNVTFKDLTQGAIISHSANCTLQNLRFEGKDGHAGVTIGRSNDVLLAEAEFYARLVHPVTLTMMASGNVVTNSTSHYEGRNDATGTDAVIDFHGIFPFENLFDKLTGFYVCPGGDMSVLPHAGVRNVFWNIKAPEAMSCYTGPTDNEFFRTYATAGTSSHSEATMYEHVPQAFFIGITRKGEKPVTIGRSTLDRTNQWFTVEGLNRQELGISSLYEAQRDLRRIHSGNSKKSMNSKASYKKDE
jgi:hypothetical protein